MRRATLVLALALAPACASGAKRLAPPVAPAAALAMAEARAAERAGIAAEARAACERALAAEPGWLAPRRMLDELDREALLGVAALEAHRAALASGLGGAAELYLAGRLEGEQGLARFETAVRLDPGSAWAWHGLAHARFARGEASAAVQAEREAHERARDPYERAQFAAALARFEEGRGRGEQALEVLERELSAPDLSAGDRAALAAQAAELRLRGTSREREAEGVELALDLLRGAALTDVELARLAGALRRRANGVRPRLAAALASAPPSPSSSAASSAASARRDLLRGELLLESGSPLALALLDRAAARGADGGLAPATLRAAGFLAGDPARAVERWLAVLPRLALGADGLPRDARLRAAVECARALPRSPAAQDWRALAEAALAAGWIPEARASAARLAPADPDAALALDARAAAAAALLARVEGALQALDDGGARAAAGMAALAASDLAPGASGRAPDEGLVALLAALAGDVAGLRAQAGGDGDTARARADLVASPRLSYGGLAEVVHPGPRFSAADERDGRGALSAPVGGLAAELRGIQRFGLFGELSGDAPDGTVLPILCEEWRAGSHVGLAFEGQVTWCERADVPSRAGRMGARIAGAALHEGYWIDVDEVRGELGVWRELEREFAGGSARVQRVLAQRGLPADPGEDGARERLDRSAPLGEAARVRLALLAERGQGGQLGAMTFDELLASAAAHEEGHLVDHALFLPVAQHFLRVMALLVRGGLSASGVASELEYRAQLVALAAAPDPRVPLSQVLDAVESPSGLTAHADAYGRLLDDLLRTLDRERARLPSIAPDRTLVHQLHRLSADELRGLAQQLAVRRLP